MVEKKINLLYFCSDYQIGLTQAHTEQLEYMKKIKDINVFAISSEKEQEKGLHERLKNTNIKTFIIPDLDVHDNFKVLSKEIGDIIKEYNITHVNIHNNWQLGLVSYLRLNPFFKKKFKSVYTIHGYRHNSPIKSLFAIAIIGSSLGLLSDKVISMSDYVSKRFWFIKPKLAKVFYMMTKPEYFKTENLVDISSLKLVFPAQFRQGKNQDLLIRAVKKYIDKTGDNSIELYLPGDGPLKEHMIKLVHDLGVKNNVLFPGKLPLSEVLQLYEKTNIALCSSNVETYGRCIAEPFMLGRCVITKKTGIAGDIIKDQVNGFFFKSEEDLVNILSNLYHQPDKIRQIANRAFKDRTVFFPDVVLNSYLETLHSL